MRIVSQIEPGPCAACEVLAADGDTHGRPHTCEPRELDAMLRADEGEPRLELDADERAGIWIVHPGGRMVRLDLHARGNFLVVVPQGSAEGFVYAMPPRTETASGARHTSCERLPPQPYNEPAQGSKED